MAGAVNTVNREGDLLVGYNTDGAGLLVSLKEDLAFEPGGAKVLILGAGGAARGALAALGNGGAVSITVANRNREKANELIGHFAGVFNKIEFHSISLEVLSSAEHLQRFDLVINTTSVGMDNTSFNGFSGSSIKGVSASFYDMVYAPP